MTSKQQSGPQQPQAPPPWLTMTPGQFATGTPAGTQGALFPVDTQGRPGGDLFEDAR
jgi:hypothetical protein